VQAHAAIRGDPGDGLDDGAVLVAVEGLAELVGLAAGAGGIPGPGQPAAASGLHGMTPMPWSRQRGSISRSSSRYSRL